MTNYELEEHLQSAKVDDRAWIRGAFNALEKELEESARLHGIGANREHLYLTLIQQLTDSLTKIALYCKHDGNHEDYACEPCDCSTWMTIKAEESLNRTKKVLYGETNG